MENEAMLSKCSKTRVGNLEQCHFRELQSSAQYPKPKDILGSISNLSFTCAAAAVFLISLVCFANSYNAEFAFDDSEALTNNKDVKSWSPIGDLFVHDFWGSSLESNTSHKSYRPFTVLTFR